MQSSHIYSDSQTVNMSRCRFSLENDRFINVTEWKSELMTNQQKRYQLNLVRWKNWVDYLEYADQARTEKQNYKSHLGGNVCCTITEGSACMNIRQYWKAQE